MRQAALFPALLFALLPLAFLAGIAAYQLTAALPDARIARAKTAASFEVLQAASRLLEAAQDAERGSRGYLITGNDAYLEPYLKAKAELPQLMANLSQALRDSPEQLQLLLPLQASLTTKMNAVASDIETYRARGYDAARAQVAMGFGLNSMRAIQANLAAITGAEKARLAARLEQGHEANRRVTMTFAAGSLISALALIAGAALLASAYRRAAVSEHTLQATLDSVREGVAAFDDNGRLRAWNMPFAGVLDLAPSLLKRGECIASGGGASPIAKELISRINDLDGAVRKSGRPALVSHTAASGKTLEVFHSRADDGYVCTILDVTDQRKAEEALRQAQRLESLGQMTGGVAHDFNNLLTIVIGSLGFLRRNIGSDARLTERIDMLEIAAERGARLTKQLLAFARRQPLRPEAVNPGQLMNEMMPLVRRAAGEEIVVESVVSGGLWNTTIDTSQFQAAVLNLVINSRHAMPQGGKLTIEAANAALDDAYAARNAGIEPGQYVLFAITDTGTGMDRETLARAMEPFFTTKPGGEGTGLGLAQVYGFVKQSGGHVKIYSEVGEGTTVKLYLPRSQGSVSRKHAKPAPPAAAGDETVLLVDDDEIVRATVASMLSDLGYKVLTAASGAEALALLEQGEKPDLLFTDVVMPGMGGRQLAERAVAILPSLRVLFTSGYTENAIVHNGRLDSGVYLLSKPYDRERLAAKLRKVLDGPGASRPAGKNGLAQGK